MTGSVNKSKYTIYNEDCFKTLNNIPSKSVDLILTDPPYNIAKYSTGNINLPGRSALNNDLANWDRIDILPKDLVADFKRILKPKGNIFIFTTYNLIGKWHEAFDSEFDTFQFMVWHKLNPAPNIFKKGFLNSCELIVCMWNKGHNWNFSNQREMHNFIETPICLGKERWQTPKHPTQKPLKVLKHILKIASNEGDTVMDPFMGVGSTGIASLLLNRNFIGIEIDEAYFNGTKERLSKMEEYYAKQSQLSFD